MVCISEYFEFEFTILFRVKREKNARPYVPLLFRYDYANDICFTPYYPITKKSVNLCVLSSFS